MSGNSLNQSSGSMNSKESDSRLDPRSPTTSRSRDEHEALLHYHSQVFQTEEQSSTIIVDSHWFLAKLTEKLSGIRQTPSSFDSNTIITQENEFDVIKRLTAMKAAPGDGEDSRRTTISEEHGWFVNFDDDKTYFHSDHMNNPFVLLKQTIGWLWSYFDWLPSEKTSLSEYLTRHVVNDGIKWFLEHNWEKVDRIRMPMKLIRNWIFLNNGSLLGMQNICISAKPWYVLKQENKVFFEFYFTLKNSIVYYEWRAKTCYITIKGQSLTEMGSMELMVKLVLTKSPSEVVFDVNDVRVVDNENFRIKVTGCGIFNSFVSVILKVWALRRPRLLIENPVRKFILKVLNNIHLTQKTERKDKKRFRIWKRRRKKERFDDEDRMIKEYLETCNVS